MYFIVSHFYHEPPAQEIGQPLPAYLTVNKIIIIIIIIILAKCAVSCDGTWQRRGFSFSNGCHCHQHGHWKSFGC